MPTPGGPTHQEVVGLMPQRPRVASSVGAHREPTEAKPRRSGRSRRAPIRYEGATTATALSDRGWPAEVYEPKTY